MTAPNHDLSQTAPQLPTQPAIFLNAEPSPKQASPTLDLRLEGYMPLSVAHTIARAHGVESDRPILMAINFAADHTIGTIPTPIADQYLQNIAIPAARPGELPITNTLQPGLLRYYYGLRPDGQQLTFRMLEPGQPVIEVNPPLQPDTQLGYPVLDAVRNLNPHQRAYLSELSPLAVAAFPTEDFISQLPAGTTALQQFNPGPANDKYIFREGAKARGVSIVPGVHIESEHELDHAVTTLSNASRVWLKVPGSGGDLVLPINGPLSKEALTAGILRLRREVQHAFAANTYALSFEEYWPPERIAPRGTKLVVEQHVNDFGRVLMNGGLTLVIDKEGRYAIAKIFRQIVDPVTGEFRGGAPLNLETENDAQILSLFKDHQGDGSTRLFNQLQGIAEHLVEDLNFVGLCGIDFWLVEHENGEVHPYFCELNGRPTLNYIPWVVAEKLAPGACVNVNIWAEHQLHSIEDLERAIGPELLYGNPDTGLVMPLALRSIQVRNQDGSLTVVKPSNAGKMLVCAPDMNAVDAILQTLYNRGIRFDSKAYDFTA